VILSVFAIGIAACPSSQPGENRLLHGMQAPDETTREGCDLAQRKCSRCHTMNRILATNVETPEAWKLYVHRMRLMPGAAIQSRDEPKIVRCLVFHSFGEEGLTTLEGDTQ